MSVNRWISAAIVVVVLLAAAANAHVLSATEESEVRVIPNPHSCPDHPSTLDASSSACIASTCEPSVLLAPHRIIRAPMPTQPDTLVEITTKKVLSVSVPVYRFRQPARLSPLELPFELVLVSDIDSAPWGSLREVPVPPAAASDSWFPGYAWSPVIYSGCADGPVHVGWKFSDPLGEFFYALIVDAKDREKGAIRLGIGALGETIAEGLSVGTRAPAWMMDLLTNM